MDLNSPETVDNFQVAEEFSAKLPWPSEIVVRCLLVKKHAVRRVKYGKLLVVGPGFNRGTWACRCDCGVVRDFADLPLRKGQRMHCGCSFVPKERRPRRAPLGRPLDDDDWRARSANSRALRRGAEGEINGETIKLAREEQRGFCPLCLGHLSEDWHIDHKKPFCHGGDNWPSNIQLTCAPCNIRKARFERRIRIRNNV